MKKRSWLLFVLMLFCWQAVAGKRQPGKQLCMNRRS